MSWIPLHEFTIPGVPKPKLRHRTGVNKKTGRPIQYADKKTKQAEGDFLVLALKYRPRTPHEGPLGVRVAAYMPIPGSWSQKKKRQALAAEIRPTSRPDADNLLKLVCDALQGTFWQNDTQLVGKGISKWYSDRPRWEIEVLKWNRNA